MNKEKPVITNVYPKSDPIQGDVNFIIDNLVQLVQVKLFRSAWSFLISNADPEHALFYNAGVVLQHLSNQYGDIGELKDECFLKKELESHSTKVIQFLV